MSTLKCSQDRELEKVVSTRQATHIEIFFLEPISCPGVTVEHPLFLCSHFTKFFSPPETHSSIDEEILGFRGWLKCTMPVSILRSGKL